MTKQICKHCRFWLGDPKGGLSDGSFEDEEPGSPTYGTCRRDPPKISEHMMKLCVLPPQFGQQTDSCESATIHSLYDTSLWPVTFIDDWCGSFTPRADGVPL